eukprot:76242-Amphidinium_carterae.1
MASGCEDHELRECREKSSNCLCNPRSLSRSPLIAVKRKRLPRWVALISVDAPKVLFPTP